MEEYDKQAEKFLKDTKTEFKVEFVKFGLYFKEDTEPRDIYKITLKRGEREYSFMFGNSLNNSGKFNIWTAKGKITTNDEREANKHRTKGEDVKKNKEFKEPTAYDFLSCVEKYEYIDFGDFCSSFGYDEDSIKAEKTFKAVQEEYNKIAKLYTYEEINKLQEIH